jgi:hypothetical protein
MDELQRILRLKRQHQEQLKIIQEKLHAIEVVERMLRDDRAPLAQAEQIPPKRYSGMKQDAAIQDALENAGGPMTAAQIADNLERGGFGFKSKEPKGPVYAALKQNRKGLYTAKKEGQSVLFGLAKWEKAEVARSGQ